MIVSEIFFKVIFANWFVYVSLINLFRDWVVFFDIFLWLFENFVLLFKHFQNGILQQFFIPIDVINLSKICLLVKLKLICGVYFSNLFNNVTRWTLSMYLFPRNQYKGVFPAYRCIKSYKVLKPVRCITRGRIIFSKL